MPKYRNLRSDEVVIIPRSLLDANLSMNAFGLLCGLLMWNDSSYFSEELLYESFNSSKEEIDNALDELENKRYFKRETLEDGSIQYHISEEPNL